MSNDPRIAPTDSETMTITVKFPAPLRFDNHELAELYTRVIAKLREMGEFESIHVFSGYRAYAEWHNGSETQTTVREP